MLTCEVCRGCGTARPVLTCEIYGGLARPISGEASGAARHSDWRVQVGWRSFKTHIYGTIFYFALWEPAQIIVIIAVVIIIVFLYMTLHNRLFNWLEQLTVLPAS